MDILGQKKISGKLILAILLAIAGFCLRLPGLTDRPVWYDEVITIFNAQSGFTSIWHRFIHGSNPPFAYFFYHAWQLIFGSSQFSYEIVSVLFGALAIILTFKIGELLFDGEAGLIAAALIAFSSYHLFVSQQIRGYAMACLFALASIYRLFKFLKTSKRFDLAGWLVASFLMMATHFYTVFLFAVEILAFVIARRSVRRRSNLGTQIASTPINMSRNDDACKIYLIGGALILFAAVAGIQIIRILNIFPFYPRPHANLSDLFLVLQSTFFLSKPVVVASILLVVWRFKDFTGNDKLQFLLAWFLISLIVPFVISWFVPSFFYVRYYIFTHLAWILMTAFTIRQIPRGTIRILVVAGFIFFLSFLIADYYQESHTKAKLKAAYEMIAEDYRPDDVIIHENGWTFGASYYYHQGKLPEFYLTDEFVVPTLENRKINPSEIKQYNRLWLMLERPESVKTVEGEPWFQNLPKKLVKSSPEFQLYLFDLKS